MKLIYKGVDITDKVKIIGTEMTDTAGGASDSVEVILSDTEKLWRQWGPEKGDMFEVNEGGFTSGTMYIHFIQDSSGKFIIKGRSIPPKSKTANTRSWENVGFKNMAGDIANSYGFTLATYGISDWFYDRVDQVNEPDFKFLSDRGVLESCCLKVHNKKIIIYSEPYMEALDPVLTLTPEDLIGDPLLTTTAEGLFSSCSVKYLDKANQLISYIFAPDAAPAGPELKINIKVANFGEAERFTKGLLRHANKNETIGNIFLKLNLELAAGNTIRLTNMGSFSGKYFIYNCGQKLLSDRTNLHIRRVLEGY